MVSVPGFLLRRLYVKESLKNNSVGYGFELKNMLGSGYAKRIKPLILDGKAIPIEQTFFLLDGRETRFDSVTNQHPFTLPMNTVIGVVVKEEKLKPGPHKIEMGFEVGCFGTLKFDVIDNLTDE